MADKKMTRKEALEFAINAILAHYSDEVGFEDSPSKLAVDTLEKMVVSINKQSSKPKGKTTARIQNEKFFAEAYKKMLARKNQEPVTATWIAENVSGVRSSQRAVWVAKIGLEEGLIKEVKVKKTTFYAVADWEPPVDGE